MRNFILFIILMIVINVGLLPAQTQESQEQSGANVYSFFVNIVNEPFHFPLVGLVNIAIGNHILPQIGLINFNLNNLSSLQTGLINFVGGDFAGLQIGLVNTTGGSFQGAQISLINLTGKINGFQIGLINYANTIENGIPIGLISIVRNGGFKAVELSINEIAHTNFAFKTGVEIFYTSFNVSWNPTIDWGYSLLTGIGLGTHISISDNFFFNPELTFMSNMNIGDTNLYYFSFAPNLGFRIAYGFSVLVAPTITWVHSVNNDGEISKTFLALYNHEINTKNNLLIGGRLALRFQ